MGVEVFQDKVIIRWRLLLDIAPLLIMDIRGRFLLDGGSTGPYFTRQLFILTLLLGLIGVS